MKNTLIIMVFAFAFLASHAQTAEHVVKSGIQYRGVKAAKADDYIASNCVLDIHYPKDSVGYSTIVWFHGGGLMNNTLEVPETLLGNGIAVVGVEYRMNPKVKSPVYVEDAAAAVAWVMQHIQEYGGDPSKVFLSGHSAGGYLASMVGYDKHYLAEFGADADSLAGLIPFSGHTITHFTVRSERGIAGTQPIVDEMAPLFHVRKDAPPTLLITGDRELELLGRYEENAYFYRMLKVVGHPDVAIREIDGYGHMMTYPSFPLLIEEVRRLSYSQLVVTE